MHSHLARSKLSENMKILQIVFILTCSSSWLHPNPIHGRLIDSCANEKNLHPISNSSFQQSPSDYYLPCAVNVKDFGAVGDGVTDDTKSFKLAWDTACQALQPVTILVPKEFIFLLQPIIFTGPCIYSLTFQIDGNIVAPDGPKSWPRNSGKRWLVFYRVNGLTLQGGGLIDGKGEKWWDHCPKNHKVINGKTNSSGSCDNRPVAIRFLMSSNLTVKEIKIHNSPEFHLRFDNCTNVLVDMLDINSPALSRNTDGIHIENTNNAMIYNSLISCGDDCVSIGTGSTNVYIKNIICGPSHGISIGSLGSHNSQACVSNITVTDSFIKHSDNGVRIKTWPGGKGSVFNITFNNIHMDTVRKPIIIDQYYCLSKSKSKECSNQSSAIYISNVMYSNIRGTYDVRSPAVSFACSDSVPCNNLTLSEVELIPSQPRKSTSLNNPLCWNAYGTLNTITVPPVLCLKKGNPVTTTENDYIAMCVAT